MTSQVVGCLSERTLACVDATAARPSGNAAQGIGRDACVLLAVGRVPRSNSA